MNKIMNKTGDTVMNMRWVGLLKWIGLLLAAGMATAVCFAQADTSLSSKTSASVEGANITGTLSESTTVGPSFQQRYPRYKLEFGDQFEVFFELSPEFNQTVSVQPDGFITLRGVGDVHVAGQTVPELTETLRRAYDKILNDPSISIILKDFEKPYFVADGQVGKPGKYELRGDTTLTQAIAIAGGFQEAAKHSQVLLFRRVNSDWVSAKIINVKAMEKQGNLHEDPYLHPGDMLFVPKSRLSKIRPFIPYTSVSAYQKGY
jgi:polysaccharide export outer membrane protein